MAAAGHVTKGVTEGSGEGVTKVVVTERSGEMAEDSGHVTEGSSHVTEGTTGVGKAGHVTEGVAECSMGSEQDPRQV